MEMTQINVRNVDKKTYRKFKGKCSEKGDNIGKALTEAMELWIRTKVDDVD